MSITKELYDEYVLKSFFTEKNFSGKYSPTYLSSNMIPCDKLPEFHYQTSFFLNFYASLYIELKKKEEENYYNIIKFAEIIDKLGIKIDNTTNHSSIYKLSSFNSSIHEYTFYVKTFEAKYNTQNELYTSGTLSASATYESGYSTILSNSKPEFGSYPNILNFGSGNYINYLILKTTTPNPTYLSSSDILKKQDYLSKMKDNNSKFKEILTEVFSQKPENILGYLLYKKIFYNVILFNIAIQNSIRNNYLNKVIANIESSSSIYDSISIDSNIIAIRSQINENKINISKLNTINFSNKNNDYLLEKYEYINKINSLNNVKYEFNKIQDNLNISTKLYNQQFKNYKSIKTYATYVIISLIIILIFIISISLIPIFSIETRNALYIILLVILIIITFLYYSNFKYVNLYEKFTNPVYYYLNTIVITPNSAGVAGSNSGYLVGKEYDLIVSTSINKVSNFKNEIGTVRVKATAGKFVVGIYTIPIGKGGTGYVENDAINFTGGGATSQALGKVKTIHTNGSIETIEITSAGNNYTSTPTYSITSASGIGVNFNLYFGELTIATIIQNTALYVADIAGTSFLTAPAAETEIIISGATTTAANRKAVITVTSSNTTDRDKFNINTEGVYYTQSQMDYLSTDKTIISSCEVGDITIVKTFNNTLKNNHKIFYNELIKFINDYSNSYNDLLNNMRLNVYTIGSKTFSQDANIYLYNLYLEKKRQIEINKVKLTNLFNMIEVIKKQINYLFNIIFVIACFSIILLVALVIFSTAPHLYIFVIILCVVLISILMIYFAFAIIQPTRMIVNKNYWAIINPSKSVISKL